ncbi:hypothetical protein [Streptomyces sp. NPDC001401]|uniref:hypothetical protein n=1 Tax=Streptomyces sp. NPDC001401 TaxID=3364570 RepID=UPI003682A47A
MDRLAGAEPVLAGLDRRHVCGLGVVEFGDEVWAFAGAVEAVGDQCPQRPMLRAADKKVTSVGRPDAVNV